MLLHVFFDRVQSEEFLSRRGASVLLQDEDSAAGREQDVLQSAARRLGVLSQSAAENLYLTTCVSCIDC